MKLKWQLPILFAVLVVLAPVAGASGSHDDQTTTGETDVYHLGDEKPAFECPADFFDADLTLELQDPPKNAAVSLTVADTMPYEAPVDVATADDPIAEITVQLGGCNRAATAIVTGLVAPTAVDYTLTTESADRLSLTAISIS